MSTAMTGVRFALYPSAAQATILRQWIGCQRVIYNAKVAEDKYFSTFARKSLSHTGAALPLDQQYAHFKTVQTPWLSEVPSQILRNGAVRWREAKQRQLKGLARAPVTRRAHGRQSVLLTAELFSFAEDGRGGHCLQLGTHRFKLGAVRWVAHRPYRLPRQMSVSVEAGRWFVGFSFEADDDLANAPRSAVELAYELNNLSDDDLLAATTGYDRGVVNRLADSDGKFYGADPVVAQRVLRKQQRIAKYQRKIARQHKGSINRGKTKAALARLQNYRARCARDWAHKTSHALAASGTRVHVLEDLPVANMTRKARARKVNGKWERTGAAAKSGLNRAILASAWGRLATYLKYKAARHHQLVVEVPAQYSSQQCSECHYTHAENRPDQARFTCQRCGHCAHADTNAARVLRQRGVAQVRAGIVAKPVKRVAFKRKHQVQTGAGCPGVPVEQS